ncbi:Cell division protein FtsZ [hydrothermal vent metagenome]|uniref:Cell division protein FtsZ n=1 Tax=hydrothermal vent metagenome TaxID=652676 RepID=A0A3B0TL80_9ZZZZ
MTPEILNFQLEKGQSQFIKVIGVGGGGGNAVNHMYRQGIRDVDFIVCNTDAQALEASAVPLKLQLGASLTEGRGAGNKPGIGKEAAMENIEDVKRLLQTNTKMVFITAGMGGGTGTGAAPVIAEVCRQMGVLTVGIVTIPFRNEGRRRVKQAIDGISQLEGHVDSLLVINNERIREMYGDFAISEAFAKADDVLTTAAKGIAEIITVPGYVNVDFADVETVMRNSGVAIMGTGVAEGAERALKAVEDALNSPLLNNNDITGAKNVLLNVNSGNTEITMDEIGEISDYVQDKAGFEADLIWGNGIDESLGEEISVTVIATGFSMSSIPEMLVAKKSEKKTHYLSDDMVSVKPSKKVPVAEEGPARPKQRTFEFDLKAQKEPGSEFDLLYPKLSKERAIQENEGRMKMDFSGMSEETIDEYEDIPAYQRKQMKIKNPGAHSQAEVSRLSVPEKSSPRLFNDNNSYLHDNVD